MNPLQAKPKNEKVVVTDDKWASVDVLRCLPGEHSKLENDFVALEEPMEIRIRGTSIAVLMRTPGDDVELAVGFLVTEGVLKHKTDLLEAAHCQVGEAAQHGNVVNVYLHPDRDFDASNLTRHVFASSSCGICGKATIDSIHQDTEKSRFNTPLSASWIHGLSGKIRSHQTLFEKTGGVHASALMDLEGRILGVREDVGRHNALDKLIGHFFIHGPWPLEDTLLLVSGRCSFEIMQKALVARIGAVLAVSAPTSLAIDFARKSNQLLIGFHRDHSFVTYSRGDLIKENF